jgi:hypothetical protein
VRDAEEEQPVVFAVPLSKAPGAEQNRVSWHMPDSRHAWPFSLELIYRSFMGGRLFFMPECSERESNQPDLDWTENHVFLN